VTLNSIQRRALITITGALRSTASDILEAYTNIPPMLYSLNKACCRAAICLATLPPSHPLFKPVLRAASRYVKSHRFPLHELFHYTKISPAKMEKICNAHTPTPQLLPPHQDLDPREPANGDRSCQDPKNPLPGKNILRRIGI
jgi:hypothetical protein